MTAKKKEEEEKCVTVCCCPTENEEIKEKVKKGVLLHLAKALEKRDNVVLTRLNDQDLKQIDALVEVELFKSRSEAVAFFIKEGIKARQDLFQKIMSTVNKIRELKEEARKAIAEKRGAQQERQQS